MILKHFQDNTKREDRSTTHSIMSRCLSCTCCHDSILILNSASGESEEVSEEVLEAVFPQRSHLGDENADTTNSLDLLLGLAREESGLDDDRDVRKGSLSEDLKETGLDAVDHRGLVTFLLLVEVVGGRGQERPELLDVDLRAHVGVLSPAEMTHTDLTEATRMVLIDVDSVVVLHTGVTVTTRVLSVLSDTTVTGGHVTALPSVGFQAGSHFVGLFA